MADVVAAEISGDDEITLDVQLAGTPDQVWDLLSDAERLPSWLGFPVIWDLRVGGRIEVEVQEGHRFAGEFVKIDPPSGMSFTWGWRSGSIDIAPGSTMVEVKLESVAGGTRFQLVHAGLGEWTSRNIAGWTVKLERLARVSGISP